MTTQPLALGQETNCGLGGRSGLCPSQRPETISAGPAVNTSFDASAGAVCGVPATGVLASDSRVLASGVDTQGDTYPTDQGEHYVSTDGSIYGDGSFDNPWSLTQVLSKPPAGIEPGDLIWVRGGLYRGPFVSHLSGAPGASIVVRAYPGEQVRLDLNNPDQWEQGFFIFGDYVTYQGFEVTSSREGARTTDQSGPFQTDVNRGGISVRGHYNKFVNLLVHDLNAGIGYWGDGGEIHGCIIYNNGWKAPDRQHGHGLYLQNEHGIKSISDNIVFNQFGAGIHAYGSEKAHLNNLYFDGNVSFNNGAGAGQGFMPERDILVGGIATTRGATLHENCTFQNGLNGVVDVGYVWGPENEDIVITDNYFVSSVRFLQPFDDVVFTGNTIVGSQRPVSLMTPQDGVINDFVWHDNRYAHGGQLSFSLDNVIRSWDLWRSGTGLDANSILQTSLAGPEVFVRPNHYETGRANITIYNWYEQPEVSVDLGSVLNIGDRYELRSAIDYNGEPVLRGVFNGDPMMLPMTNRSAISPTGYHDASPVGTDSRFGVFVLSTVSSRPGIGELSRNGSTQVNPRGHSGHHGGGSLCDRIHRQRCFWQRRE